jgi:hypothetical protein
LYDGYSSGQVSSRVSSIELISAPSGEFGSTFFKPSTSVTYSGPSFFSNSITFWDNVFSFLVVLVLISLADLPAETVDLAISLGLSLIAFDDSDNLLCICFQFGRAWPILCKQWRSAD